MALTLATNAAFRSAKMRTFAERNTILVISDSKETAMNSPTVRIIFKFFLLALAIQFLTVHLSLGVEYDFTSLDKSVETELRRAHCPGTSIAIVLNDQIIYARAYGIANVDTGATVSSDMLFRLGSTTKMFTAAGLLTLVAEGSVQLHAPIGEYVSGLDSSIACLTSHQLLTHTSGLADPNAMYGPHDELALESKIIALSAVDLFDAPDGLYSYSNPGYWTAGLVIQKASGKLYADHLDDCLFKPLGMKQTTFRPTAAMTWPLAVGHGPEDRTPPKVIRPLADNAAAWPAGQLFSTASEFARFCLAFMNDGKLEGKQVLSKFVVEQMSLPHVAVPNDDRHYGYGLSIRDVQGLRWLSHSGSRTGYGSHARMCPEKRFAIVILCNKTGISLTPVADMAAKIVLGIEPEAVEKPNEIELDSDEMHRLVGVYANGSNKTALELRDDGLFFSMNRSVIKTGERSFVALASNVAPRVEFSSVVDEDGNVTYLLSRGRAFKRIGVDNPAGSH